MACDKIAPRGAVARDTVSTWIDQGEQLGPVGFTDKPRRGNPGCLTATDQLLVFDLAKPNPHSLVGVRAALLD